MEYSVKVLLLLAVAFENASSKQPNIVVFLTDDLDSELGGMTPLIKTKSWIADEGATFTNSFVVVPICCPSRSSILTGLYQHNTQVVNNSISGNCYGEMWVNQSEKSTFATMVHDKADYTTFYAGKYLNRYGTNGDLRPPPGWDWWNGLVGNSRYYNYKLSVNGTEERHGDVYEEDYLTDVIGRKAMEFFDHYEKSGRSDPFLMVLATPSPHAPFTPAPQYANHFQNETAPRTPAFNYVNDVDDQKHWFMRTNPKPMNQELIDTVCKVL